MSLQGPVDRSRTQCHRSLGPSTVPTMKTLNASCSELEIENDILLLLTITLAAISKWLLIATAFPQQLLNPPNIPKLGLEA